MLVSIIIPSYNSKNTIIQTVKSAVNQSNLNKEIILVDDGSFDNTINVVKEQFKDIDFIHILNQENGGACSARNLGLHHSKGDFIQFLDADDILHPEKIKSQLDLWDQYKNESIILSGQWDRFINDTSEAKFPSRLLDRDWENPIEWL
jgi:glycosyltransferase involved in cell wall biosynthesis